jgi:hypothetical protein
MQFLLAGSFPFGVISTIAAQLRHRALFIGWDVLVGLKPAGFCVNKV